MMPKLTELTPADITPEFLAALETCEFNSLANNVDKAKGLADHLVDVILLEARRRYPSNQELGRFVKNYMPNTSKHEIKKRIKAAELTETYPNLAHLSKTVRMELAYAPKEIVQGAASRVGAGTHTTKAQVREAKRKAKERTMSDEDIQRALKDGKAHRETNGHQKQQHTMNAGAGEVLTLADAMEYFGLDPLTPETILLVAKVITGRNHPDKGGNNDEFVKANQLSEILKRNYK